MLTLIFAAIFVLLFSLLWYLGTLTPNKFPPGPFRYPVIGSLFFMYEICEVFKENTLIHAIFKNVDRYGKVFGFYMGKQPFVVVADYDILKEVLKDEAICHRQDMTPINEYRPGYWTVGEENKGSQPGVSFSQGPYWKEQRRFLLRNLRDFGFGKSEMEDTLLDEVDKLCNEYSKLEGKEVCLDNTMNLSIINALWAILTGEKLPLHDPKLLKIVSKFTATVKHVKGIGNLFLSLTPPQLMRLELTKKNSGLNTWDDAVKNMTAFLEEQVKQHKATIDEDSSRDMMDLFLKEIEKTTDVESSFYQERGHFAMINGFMDLFVAGMETTSSSLLWTFLYMLHHPDIKQKVHYELDKVVGRGQSPRLHHQEQLHFTNAVLHESMRISCVVYNAINHVTSDEIAAGDYVIPKGTVVIPSLMNVLLDPEHFLNPQEFNPSRFLNKNGEFEPDERVIPFSIGKRYCLGKSLAEKEFFLFFTGIMAKFDINPAPNQYLPSYRMKDYYLATIVRSPPTFNLVLTSR